MYANENACGNSLIDLSCLHRFRVKFHGGETDVRGKTSGCLSTSVTQNHSLSADEFIRENCRIKFLMKQILHESAYLVSLTN